MPHLKCPFSRPVKSISLCSEKCTFRKPESLTDCVECYKMYRLRLFHATLHLFAGEADKKLKLEYAVRSVCPICKIHHPHQAYSAKRLAALWVSGEKNFKSILGQEYKNFETLYKDFENIVENTNFLGSEKNNKLKPFKTPKLLLYDIALRISVIKGVLPRKMVYLQRGTLKGYKILKEKKQLNLEQLKGNDSECVTKKCFPSELQTLTAYEIEDFLCHCHECFEQIGKK